jgi:hypothetical protein
VSSPKLLVLLALAACAGDGDSASPPSAGSSVQPEPGGRCVVRLHGKGGTGAATVNDAGVAIIAPTGNADGWGGRQWLYFPDEEYAAARTMVADSVEECGQIILDGFSNGAAFAAKLYCRGETFDGRLVRVVVDDPVVDAGVEGCMPDPSVDVVLYWTGGLEATARPGWNCAEGDWTCEGGVTIGIDAFAEALATDVLESPFDEHRWFLDAPELDDWPA